MTILPPELLQAKSFLNTADSAVFKPVYGTMGSMYAEFRVHNEPLGGESKLKGREIKRPVELVLIQSDKFSRVPKRVGNWETGESSELTRQEQIDLAPLYERFRTQKDSTDTLVIDWEFISDQDKAQLHALGIWTVEQLHNLSEHERYKLGPGWKDLHEAAVRHVKTKRGDDEKREREVELELLREENRKLAEKQKEAEERYFQMQEQLARLERGAVTQKRGPGRRPKQSLEQEQIEKAEAA